MNMRLLVLSSLLTIGFINCNKIERPITPYITSEDLSKIKKEISPQEQAMITQDIQERIDRFKKLKEIEYYEEWKSIITALNQSEKNYAEAFNRYIQEENDINWTELEAAYLTVILMQSQSLPDVEKKIDDMNILGVPSQFVRMEVLIDINNKQ